MASLVGPFRRPQPHPGRHSRADREEERDLPLLIVKSTLKLLEEALESRYSHL